MSGNIGSDALLESLVLYTKLYYKAYSAEALTAGLPNSPKEETIKLFSKVGSKSLFSRAAARAGLKSTLIERPISKLLDLQLPSIALLAKENACIVEQFSPDRKQVKIIYAAQEALEEWVDVDKLEEEYLGFSFLLKKAYIRASEKESHIHTHKKHWFFDTLKLSKTIYGDVLLATFLVNLFVLATPLFTMNVYDRVIPNSAKETLLIFTIGVVIVYIIDAFLKYGRSYLLEIAGKKSDIIMSSIVCEKVMDLKMSAHPKSVGSFASNLKDFDFIRSFLTNSTLSVVIDLPFAVIFLLVIYFIGGSIVVIPLVTIVLILSYAFIVRKPLARAIEDSHEASARKNGHLIESLNNIETIKTHNMSGRMQHEWEEATGEISTKGLKSRMLSSSIPTVTGLFTQLNTVFVVFYGVYLIEDFSLSMGALIAVVILTSRTIAPMAQVASLITNYEDAKTAFNAIEDILAQPLERPAGKEFLSMPELKVKIEFKDVSFTYPDSEKPALQNISFVIEPNEKVGVIGRIGSGKSTIEKLILGLYAPDSGTVLIDDIDINQLDPADLRRNISYVPQDITLFRGNIKDNILSRSPHGRDEDLLKAVRLSGVEEFVKLHPSGLGMAVGERGIGLSGGQRQSVGIARALMLESPLVLLDEPTNAMDQLTERRIIQNLTPYIQDKTFILVTQKMDLLSMVERVIVMHESKIYLDGKKEDVLKKLSTGDANA